MSSDVSRAKTAFAVGRKKYSRGVMKSVMNHCFRCHSMTTIGKSARWKISSFKGLELSPAETVDLMVASRNYSGALGTLEDSLKNKEYALEKPFDYEGSLKKYLALVIRLEKKPDRAIETFGEIESEKFLPEHLRSYLQSWSASLQAWKSERKASKNTLGFASQLLKKGRDRQSYFKDHAGDVEFLRVAESLHSALMTKKTPMEKAQHFLLLGETYEVLDELGYWALHEVYYENCVRAVPKTKIGKQCYDRLRTSLFLGYSGSSGTHLPESEKRRLQELKKLTESK